MQIPASKHYIIVTLLRRYLAHPEVSSLTQIAREHQAVPLYGSWTGTTFLRTDGVFFTLDQEDRPGEFIPESDEHWQIACLATAARDDPSFRPLLPERSSAATVCSFCDGRGFLQVGERKVDITCGECAGLGWCDPNLNQRAV